MTRDILKLIIGATAAILLIVAGLYYYVVIYSTSLDNGAEINIPDVEVPSQSSSSEGGGGSLKP